MRFLHTSDWHIGRQFHNVSLLEDQAYVFDQIIDIVSEYKIDAVLISGDIYDRSVPPAAAIELLDSTLNRICLDLKVPVVMISGNHDSSIRLSFACRQMENSGLFIYGSLSSLLSPVILDDDSGKVAIYCIPYCDPTIVRNHFGVEISSFDQAYKYLTSLIYNHYQQTSRNIVLAHLLLEGGVSTESERPLTIGGLEGVSASHFSAFDYCALGHLHRSQHKLDKKIRYSGSIMKYSFSEEKHNKSVTMFDLDEKGKVSYEEINLTLKRDLRVIEGSLQDLLESSGSDSKKNDYLMVRLTDTQAILDVMNKLREVYPNVLHLERPGLTANLNTQTVDREQIKKGELSMFKDFYLQASGEEPTDKQIEVIKDSLKAIHQEKEE